MLRKEHHRPSRLFIEPLGDMSFAIDMKNANQFDIAVVGAGPVGLAAALALGLCGYRVSLVGPLNPHQDERTSALLAGSIDLLERIGVWQSIRDNAAPLQSLRIIDATDRLIRAPEVLFASSEIGLEAFGFNTPNLALVAALEKAVAESGVRRIVATVTDAVPGPDAVELALSTNTAIEASLVVGADGRRSQIRKAGGITTREWRHDQSALVVNLRHSRSHHDTSTEFHTTSGPFTLVPLPGRRSSLVWVGRTNEVKSHAALSDDELAVAIEKQSASILGSIEIDGKRQVFPLVGMNASRFAAERIALIGEAAHVFPPIGAQGLNLGYRDVSALANLLKDRPADPGSNADLTAYENARRGDVLSRTAAVEALNRTLLSDFLPLQGLRGAGFFLLDRLTPLRRMIMRHGTAAE